jgi:hypothetical protein
MVKLYATPLRLPQFFYRSYAQSLVLIKAPEGLFKSIDPPCGTPFPRRVACHTAKITRGSDGICENRREPLTITGIEKIPGGQLVNHRSDLSGLEDRWAAVTHSRDRLGSGLHGDVTNEHVPHFLDQHRHVVPRHADDFPVDRVNKLFECYDVWHMMISSPSLETELFRLGRSH